MTEVNDVIEGLVVVGEKIIEWEEQEEKDGTEKDRVAREKLKQEILAKGSRYFGPSIIQYLEFLDDCSVINQVFERNYYVFKNLPRMVDVMLRFDVVLQDQGCPYMVFVLPDYLMEFSSQSPAVHDIVRAFALARRRFFQEEKRAADNAITVKEPEYVNVDGSEPLPDEVVVAGLRRLIREELARF